MMKNIFLLLLFLFNINCKTEISNKINPPEEVVNLFENYTKLWSDGNLELISNNIYDQPMFIYSNDSILYLKSNEDVKSFLSKTFNTLESNNYGFSTINRWESYREDKNYIIIEMNYTRFLKDSTIMGAKNRTATYILRKKNGEFKISALIPHTPVSE
jgi:hypothetical protein